jgi:hypothetical protein
VLLYEYEYEYSDVINHQGQKPILSLPDVATTSPNYLSIKTPAKPSINVYNTSALASLVRMRISHSEHPSPLPKRKRWQEACPGRGVEFDFSREESRWQQLAKHRVSEFRTAVPPDNRVKVLGCLSQSRALRVSRGRSVLLLRDGVEPNRWLSLFCHRWFAGCLRPDIMTRARV